MVSFEAYRAAAFMGLGSLNYRAAWHLEKILSGAQVRLCERRGSLLVLFLHGLLTPEELENRAAYPQQGTTPAHLGVIIEYLQKAGYIFTSPEQLDSGLDPTRKYALITFDDGYFNNSRAVPVLEKYSAPATIFVSATHTAHSKGYWWETLHHVRVRQGWSLLQIQDEMCILNVLPTRTIIEKIKPELGEEIFQWRGDADRPLSRAELQKLAQHPLISIGNHTADHDILTSLSPEEAKASLSRAQALLKEITGKLPICIAYPNGHFSPEIVKASTEVGLKFGFTTEPHKNYLPQALAPSNRMTLGRFAPFAERNLKVQCQLFRSDLMLVRRWQQLKKRLATSPK